MQPARSPGLGEPGTTALAARATGDSTRSLHLYYPTSKDHGPTCVYDTGTAYLSTVYKSFCAGNNDGLILSHAYGDVFAFGHNFTFGPEKGPLNVKVQSVYISRYSGTSVCAF
jgi:hypothetical protein